MSKPQHSDVDWQPFPPGTLVNFAGRERTRRRRQFLTKAGTVTAALVVSLSAGYLALRPSQNTAPNYGGIACAEVRRNMSQYASAELDLALAEKIRIHLEQCPECQRAWREMMQPSPQVSDVSYLDPGESCACPICQRPVPGNEPVFPQPIRDSDSVPVQLAMSR